ncbi:adenylate kinase [Oscillatoria salina IIICB1]|uniref:adenylate kinase n=1 Tax=Oscillatoria salina TaxID=331517 RepID=UPI0021E1D858|nr:adenylate kinase [Oscillatoria salina IIICB1]
MFPLALFTFASFGCCVKEGVTRLIFLGAPGAGKGTQAGRLASSLEIPHISTGEILRNAIKENTLLGQKAQKYVDAGELVPDELILDLIRERLSQSDAREGWILDGFPRNVTQAEFLLQLLAGLGQKYDWVLNLEVPDEVLVERLLKRGRLDDTEETIRRRLDVYREQTEPLIDFYRQRQLLQSIDGDRHPEQVTESLLEAIAS